MGRDDVYPARTSKVGSLLHYVIAYLAYAVYLVHIRNTGVNYCSVRFGSTS